MCRAENEKLGKRNNGRNSQIRKTLEKYQVLGKLGNKQDQTEIKEKDKKTNCTAKEEENFLKPTSVAKFSSKENTSGHALL